MQNEKSLLTESELEIVAKLETEMFMAMTRAHMNFYKKEIQAIFSQAKRRHQFLVQHSN
ncbi:hypothetical protein [Metabacillus sediminilitoris]|uniref:hypothetical protein n=1 Tax=Metabacillus sediminilitoris TaxID=2567941 RepID=UPI0012D7A604|nr:hypothetical protein [Metabacillus sediminilitoris]QGQ46758.1 hypothetical protein GMB29_16905 [Metabacillus sediminilitoris]